MQMIILDFPLTQGAKPARVSSHTGEEIAPRNFCTPNGGGSLPDVENSARHSSEHMILRESSNPHLARRI
jgi:hypothetical protein